MLDITQKPYFCYDNAISQLLQAIQSRADIHFHGFRRKFQDDQQFMISNSQKRGFWIKYWGELYHYGVFEKNTHLFPSAFNMWDHLPFAPPEIYDHLKNKYNEAHGLTIIQQYDTHTDSFIFATSSGNNQSNHFYLNQKELFIDFMNNFYSLLKDELSYLTQHTFILPGNTPYVGDPISSLTHRQIECAQFLVKGLSAKEIGRKLSLSPRTVESHLDVLKGKFRIKEREQLIKALSRFM